MKNLIYISIIGSLLLSSCGTTEESVKSFNGKKQERLVKIFSWGKSISWSLNKPVIDTKYYNEGDTVYNIVDETPKLLGGISNYLRNNLRFPIIASENGITGRVVVAFIIEKDGSVNNIKVIKPIDPCLDKEAYRVVKVMPKWIPGKLYGKPVRVSFIIPLSFELY